MTVTSPVVAVLYGFLVLGEAKHMGLVPILGMLALGACSTEQMVGTGAGGVAGYALGGKTGAAAGAVGGGILGTILD